MTREQIQQHLEAGTITAIQADVLTFRLRGFSWRQIAFGMNKAPATVRGHHDAAVRRIDNAPRKETAG